MSPDIPFYAGIAGMCCILAGFFLVQSHRWSPDDATYDLLNAVGSALLIWYAWAGAAWPFFVLNTVWMLYSLKDLLLSDLRGRKIVRKG
jgi:hypothetical protein